MWGGVCGPVGGIKVKGQVTKHVRQPPWGGPNCTQHNSLTRTPFLSCTDHTDHIRTNVHVANHAAVTIRSRQSLCVWVSVQCTYLHCNQDYLPSVGEAAQILFQLDTASLVCEAVRAGPEQGTVIRTCLCSVPYLAALLWAWVRGRDPIPSAGGKCSVRCHVIHVSIDLLVMV